MSARTPASDRPTLLLVTPYFAPAGGGLEVYVRHLIQSLVDQHRWRVVVVTSGARHGPTRREELDGLRIYRLPYQLQLSNTRFGVTWRRELKRIIAVEAPDLINAHAPVPGLADLVATVAGSTPLVVTYHAGSMRKGRWHYDLLIGLYEAVLLRRLLARAAWVVCSSDFLRDSFLAAFRAKCSTVTPGIDVSAFRPAGVPGKGRVLFVGGLNQSDAHKGLDPLLEVFAALRTDRPGLTLDIAGSGDQLARLEELCRSRQIDDSVRFLGRLSGSELEAAYHGASVLALPTRNESFGMVLLEAMACGIPVVSTTVGGVPGVVHDGREGFLVDPDDRGALTDRLARILDDPELGARMGAAGRQRALRSCTWQEQAARTDAIFRSVLAGKPGEGVHRLAIVAPYFHPKIGGLEHYAYQVARGLNQLADYEVIVLTSNHERRRTTVEVLDGLTVFRFPIWVTASNTPVSPLWPWRLRRTMSDNHVDLVNVHTPVPYMAEAAAVAAGSRPLVVTYHSGSMLKNRRVVDIAIRWYEEHLLPVLFRRAAAVIAVSPSVAARFLNGAADHDFVIAPGVDDTVFIPLGPGQLGPARPTLLFVGRLERSSAWKGVACLLEAFAMVLHEVPEAELVLVGDGDAAGDHRRAAASLGIGDRVRFLGMLSGSALVEAYQQASLVVLPSTTESESFGMSLIEAMACQKPVVGSDIGGIPFVIDDGHDGFLVPPADARSLAKACLGLLRDPELAAEMGVRGHRKVTSQYSWPSRIESYQAVFDSVLSRSRQVRSR